MANPRQQEAARAYMTTHGASTTPAYRSWKSMIQRCTNPNFPKFPSYGGRGITVCDRWRSFENFLADMGERPDGTTLDRFPDNNGGYTPDNCRWATPTEQQNNRRLDPETETAARKRGWATRRGEKL